jgi:hypothetical protein
MLEKRLFSSVQDLARRTCILPSMVDQRLTNSMSFIVNHLRWILHKLNEAQSAARVQMSNELLRIVRSVQHQDWQFFLTFDES